MTDYSCDCEGERKMSTLKELPSKTTQGSQPYTVQSSACSVSLANLGNKPKKDDRKLVGKVVLGRSQFKIYCIVLCFVLNTVGLQYSKTHYI